LSAIK